MCATQKTVLIVDDEEQVRLLTQRVLQEAGYHVLTAPDGFQALRLLTRVLESVDLLLVDVSMPGMSGVQLAEQLRTQSTTPRVLFMSGFSSLAGSDSLPGPFLPKPFTHTALLSEVDRLLGAEM